MKNKFIKRIFISCLLFLTVFCLVACTKTEMCTVNFYDGETLVNTQTVEKGQKVTSIEITNGDHELVGWTNTAWLENYYFDFDETIECDSSYYAEWTSTCTFKNDDGSVIETKEVKNGDTAKPSSLPTKANDDYNTYAFKEWEGSLVCNGEDYEVKAVFEATKVACTVTFHTMNGGLVSEAPVSIGATVTQINYMVPDDDYYEYELLGWKTSDGTEYDFETKVNDDLDLYPITKRTPLPIDFTDKVLSMIGDSVSTFYKAGDKFCSYYTGTNQFYYPTYCPMSTGSQTYWAQLITKLGMQLGVNESLSGSSCYGTTDKHAMSQTRIDHLDDNGTPDIISIFIGINDNAGGCSYENFEYGYDLMLSRVTKTYPNAYVFCTLLPYSNYHLNLPTNHGKYSEENRVAYNEIILKLIDKYQIGCIDLEQTQNVNTWSTILNDNLHPSVAGHKKWYEQFLKDFKNYFNQTKETYTITYNINCDDATMSARPTTSYHKGDSVTLPYATRDGYTFTGWFTTEDCSTRQVKTFSNGSGDKVYYAEWLETPPSGQYYIKYYLNGGTFTDESQSTYEFVSGTKGALPTPVKEGYTFKGWYGAPELIGNPVTSTSANIKLYAKWQANS